jgi:hypothetical protein
MIRVSGIYQIWLSVPGYLIVPGTGTVGLSTTSVLQQIMCVYDYVVYAVA